MIAAIYARKSQPQPGVTEEAKSCTRQIEHAKAYAARKGWTVAEEHIYIDDDISGAEFARRPGYMRLLGTLGKRAPFDVLIVSELSRLGREQIETAYACKQLAQAGVRVFCYLEDKEVTLDSPTDKFLMSAVAFAAEVEREKARQRVSDGMLRRARQGHVCGGSLFGYRNVRLDGHVDREIVKVEAEVVRRIFEMRANGDGIKAIAKKLNDERIRSPRSRASGRPQAWAPSSVRAVLHNETYAGVAVYNRTKQRDAWGQTRYQDRPPTEWIRVDVPHLRIVDETLWSAAHAKIETAKQVYVRSQNGQLWGRPPDDAASKYLLSGFGRCAACGASMTVRTRHHGGPKSRKRVAGYTCASFDNRGSSVCSNGLWLPLEAADEAILSHLADVMLDPDIVAGAIEDAIRELRPSRDAIEEQRQRLQGELKEVEAAQGRYIQAIGVAGNVAALAAAVSECETRRRAIQGKLDALDGQDRLATFDVASIRRDLAKRVKEWRGLLKRQTPIARQMLARLLDGRIVWTPRKDERAYEFMGAVRYDGLLRGILGVTEGMVSPTGFEPVFQP